MTDYLATVHHEKLNVDFSVKIDIETFKRRKDNDIIECFESDGTCRKFLKSFLKMKKQLTEQPPKTKKKSEIVYSEEPILNPEMITDIEKEKEENGEEK